MGATKSDLFNKKQNETASLLKAIAHPARIAIVGNTICYCLNEKSIQKLKVYFETIENKISKQNKCC